MAALTPGGAIWNRCLVPVREMHIPLRHCKNNGSKSHTQLVREPVRGRVSLDSYRHAGCELWSRLGRFDTKSVCQAANSRSLRHRCPWRRELLEAATGRTVA